MHYMLVALRLPCKGCYRISITSAFLCGREQKIQIRYVCTRISDTSEQDLIAFNLKNNKHISVGKCDGFRISIANKSTVGKTITKGTYQTGVFPKMLNNSSA